MKRIIGDKLYDTDKATLVAKDCDEFNEEFCDAFDIISSALYIKRTGEWFLYCEGGSHTCYGEQFGGPQIKPTIPHEAKLWLAENNFVDEYIQYFGEPEE